MQIAALTIAFGPASQFARTIIEYRKYRQYIPYKHIVALGYYPINTEKNNRDIRLLCESFGDVEIWDPGSNIGCAQTQSYLLNHHPEMDAFFNIDPDSACSQFGWDLALKNAMDKDHNCIVASCWSTQWEPFKDRLEIKGSIGKAIHPVPFNLSLWRASFFRDLGGIPQVGEHWGETEGPTHYHANQRGKYHIYLMDYLENLDGKFMQDKQLLEYKDAYLRTAPPNDFIGTYEEYLRYKYPELLAMDTKIAEDTVFQ